MQEQSTALIALNSILTNQNLARQLTNLKIYISNKVSINTKESVIPEVEIFKPNFLFISSSLPGVVKIEEVIAKTKELFPKTKVILVLAESDKSKTLDLLLNNVDAILHQDNLSDSVDFAIKQVLKGQPFICGKSTQELRSLIHQKKSESRYELGLLSHLTDRESEVLHYLTQGSNYKQISKTLFISESTVKTHINNIFTKLNVNDRTRAVLYALKHGIENIIKKPQVVQNLLNEPVQR